MQYDIVFNCSKAYASYLSVVINSIINTTNGKLHEYECYCFHVLSSDISDNQKQKLSKLVKELNRKFICSIYFYHVDDSLFENFKIPKYYDSYNVFLRLFLGSILPVDIQKCLYLDVDILVLNDIRNLFKLDLQDKIFAATFILKHTWADLVSRDGSKIAKMKGPHFNSGVMLINLLNWRAEQIEKQSIDFIKTFNIPSGADEYILNAIIDKKKILSLDFRWNFLIGFELLYKKNKLYFLDNSFDVIGYTLGCKKNEFLEAYNNINIVHYTYLYMPKPWDNLYGFLDENYNIIYYSYYDTWWDIACRTPIYSDLFINKKQKMLNSALIEYSKSMSKKLIDLENRFNYDNMLIGAPDRVKNYLSYKIGNKIIKDCKNLKIFLLPFLY
ncbi:glycosyltransferase family 8 protein [Campylobacter jejuni]|nr:glycosyltransferase family 8 protein [Campylobacter jejuni]